MRGLLSWTLRYRRGSKRKQLTLGSYPDISLTKAARINGELESCLPTL